jgi:molybdate transport system substrate-binding protein
MKMQSRRAPKSISERSMGVTAGCLALCLCAPCWAVDLMVSAASSLTNAFQEIGKAYEKEHPGTRVLFNFGASGQLLQQIARGAPADVFASADEETMNRAQKQNLIARESRVDFAVNKLLLITPDDSKLQISKLQDLTQAQVQRIALGNPETVPVGRYTKAALEKAGLWNVLEPKYIYTQNVRQSLDYVFRGEVEAGFVYLTDASVSPVSVHTAFEVATDQPIVYPIAAVKGYGNENRALDFIAFVRSDAGRKVLDKYGFRRP